MVSKTVYAKAILFLICLFLAGLNLLVFFFAGVIGSLVTGSYVLFVGGLFYLALFLIFAFFMRKLEPAWEEVQARLGFKPKSKTTKEAFKESLPTFGIFILAFAVYFALEWYFRQFPSEISKVLAGEILRSILTIDGILLGFDGVILAQFLWAIHSKGNLIYEQMITQRAHGDVVAHLNEELSRLGNNRLGVIIGMFYAAMPTLASFLLCFTKLTLTQASSSADETVVARTVLYDPISATITGILLLVGVSLAINLLPKRGRWPSEAANTN